MNNPYVEALKQSFLSPLSPATAFPATNLHTTAHAPAALAPTHQIIVAPEELGRLQAEYAREFSALWQKWLAAEPPELPDKRFSAPEWTSSVHHAFNAAMYLLNRRFLIALADAIQAPPQAKKKIRFAVEQTANALSPANFLATNPAAQKKLIDTKGESLAKGLSQMVADLHRGRISHTDESAFEVGKSVATTAGAVVFENALFQLIQYKPLTPQVYQRPLLMVPPCINKFYIMDLQPDNSLVRYTVEQGHTVFLLSWRNADVSMSRTRWDDYIEEGVLKSIDLVQEITGQKQINALGFCVGGTMLAIAVAILSARRKNPVASLSLLTTMLDYSDTGPLDVFVDEASVKQWEQKIGAAGLMHGRDFISAFSSLRPNDLVWNYVEANYLKGEHPPAFDLLYWNADSTNLPGPMFCWYLRHLYLEDALKTPGTLQVAGEQIDLGKINVPSFIFASREDHIVPWKTAYATTALINTDQPSRNRFVLGASGHIAGVINPPAKRRRSFWVGADVAANAEEWLASAQQYAGSWWPHWAEFLAENGGKTLAAPRKYGNARFKPIEPAPGRYVVAKAE